MLFNINKCCSIQDELIVLNTIDKKMILPIVILKKNCGHYRIFFLNEKQMKGKSIQ